MKKRLVSLLAVMALTAVTTAGCGSSSKPAETTAAATEAKAAEETAVTETEAAAAETADMSGVKAGFIFLHDENSTYDLNFLNAAKEACEKAGIPIYCWED